MKRSDIAPEEWVAVKWYDSISYPGWRFLDSECNFGIAPVTTMGILIENKTNYITVACSYSPTQPFQPEQINNAITIPKSAILEIFDITELEHKNLTDPDLLDDITLEDL